MPIIYPDRCKGVTSGALREVARQGFTTASNGLFSTDFLRNQISSETSNKLYFLKTEPAGIYMSELNTVNKQLEESTEAIESSSHKLVVMAKNASKQLSEVSGDFRNGTEKLTVAIDKLMKVAGSGDFEKTVSLTVELVGALERLAALEQKGLLDKVMKAMSK